MNKFSKNLKANFLGNLNTNTWKLADLQVYLSGSNYTANSGSEFYNALTQGISLDNKQGTTTINSYYDKLTNCITDNMPCRPFCRKKRYNRL